MYRHQVNRGQKRSSSRRSSLCAEQVDGDLVAAMERVSLGTTEAEATIKVPSLAEYAQGAVSSGKDGEEPVDEVDVRTIRASRPIPHDFSSVKAYLQAMQEHSQQEFEATLRNAFDSSKQTKDGGWFTVTCVRERAATCDGKVSLHLVVSSPMIDGEPCHDFENDPWSRHAVQFQGFEVPAIVKVCAPAGGKESAKLILYSPHGYKATPKKSDHLFTRVRSLGYVGSFLREYDSTVRLFSGLAVSSLLPVVASPSGTIHGHRNVTGNGTFVDVNSGSLKTSTVPLNEAQRRAVRSLRGGLDIIVGPPGTGKSTTIWHIINSRVARDSRVLVTCTRNQAVDAVSQKVASLGVLDHNEIPPTALPK